MSIQLDCYLPPWLMFISYKRRSFSITTKKVNTDFLSFLSNTFLIWKFNVEKCNVTIHSQNPWDHLNNTARFLLNQVHGSHWTKEYYIKYSWRILADMCMVSEVLRIVLHCCALWKYPSVALDVHSRQTATRHLGLFLILMYSKALGCQVLQ